MQETDWRERAAGKRAKIEQKIPPEWRLSSADLGKAKAETRLTGAVIESLLDPKTLKITSLDSHQIVDAVGCRSWSALAIVTAFCTRTAIAHQLNSNVIEVLFESALETARQLDADTREHAAHIKPLHAIPFSMKDVFHVKGGETTAGYVGWIGAIEDRPTSDPWDMPESDIVTDLRALGAIPIAKTTLTQTLKYAETNNNILGYNKNPVNQNLSSGGSSGGQGSLQALRGTILGLGTENGGSVSMVAAFNGLYSIVPTCTRLSTRNVVDNDPGRPLMPTRIGILGNDLPCIKLAFSSLLTREPWLRDPAVEKRPWNIMAYQRVRDEARSGLKLAVMENDGHVHPHLPIQRALDVITNALKADGHTVVDWSPPSQADAEKIQRLIADASGNDMIRAQLALSGEPAIPELRDSVGVHRPAISLPEFYKLSELRTAYNQQYQGCWNKGSHQHDAGQQRGPAREIDAVIQPIAPHAAVIPGDWKYFGYSVPANVLDRPVIVIPVTTVQKSVDQPKSDFNPYNDLDRENWNTYDPDIYDGAPVGLQIIGRRFEEEHLLAVAKVVVEALRAYQKV